MISYEASFNLYKSKKFRIGIKKSQVDYLENLCRGINKLNILHLIRDPRDIYLSKKKISKKREIISSSVLINSYLWIKIVDYLYLKHLTNLKIYKYENILENPEKFLFFIKKLLKLKKQKKRYILPKRHTDIHPNINKKLLIKNKKNIFMK